MSHSQCIPIQNCKLDDLIRQSSSLHTWASIFCSRMFLLDRSLCGLSPPLPNHHLFNVRPVAGRNVDQREGFLDQNLASFNCDRRSIPSANGNRDQSFLGLWKSPQQPEEPAARIPKEWVRLWKRVSLWVSRLALRRLLRSQEPLLWARRKGRCHLCHYKLGWEEVGAASHHLTSSAVWR